MGRKAVRRITVDAHEYRWSVAGDGYGNLDLSVTRVGGPGQRLTARFRFLVRDEPVPTGPGTWFNAGPPRVVTPADVRAVILEALRRGWEPGTTKPPGFVLDDADTVAPPS